MTEEIQVAEALRIAGVPEPGALTRRWPPQDWHGNKGAASAPPPDELVQFVRSLSILGVPPAMIVRRVQEVTRERRYKLKHLYSDFSDHLRARQSSGQRYKRRARLVEKHDGWKPLQPSGPISMGDLMHILQSDLDSHDLARLYGVSDSLIRGIRSGQSRYTKHLSPKLVSVNDAAMTLDLGHRARTTASIALDLVRQLRTMVDIAYEHLEEHGPIRFQATGSHKRGRSFPITAYRLNPQSDEWEERLIRSGFEWKSAKAAGWSKDPPPQTEKAA